jgi:hypothetical protein
MLLSAGLALLASAAAVTAQSCAVPTKYSWTSSGALAQPKNGWVALKDCTYSKSKFSPPTQRKPQNTMPMVHRKKPNTDTMQSPW